MPGSRGLTGSDKSMLSVLLTGDEFLTIERLAHKAGKLVRKSQAVILTDWLARRHYAVDRISEAGLNRRYWSLTKAGRAWALEQLGRVPVTHEEIPAEPEAVL